MGLWKITDKGPKQVPETKFKQEKLLEENLEDWICSDGTILGEPLYIIGRQVLIPDIKDRLDVLALDPQGNAVIIELKRGKLKDPVDMQALRYASYISKWRFSDFENVARHYFNQMSDPEFNFNSLYESFCESANVDEIPDINTDQRAIIVGSSVREKLGSVALWLYEHTIDIKVIEVQAFKDGSDIFIEPNIVVPVQVSKFSDTGKIKPDGSPWLREGKIWHLEKRCSPATKNVFLQLDQIIQDNLEIDGPHWNQKHYVSYRVSNINWLSVITSPNYLRLDFLVKKDSFKSDEIANRLKVKKFDKEESLSEKFNLPSSVLVLNRNDKTDRIYLRIKDDFKIDTDQFLSFLSDAYKAFYK
jgi:hypothetical protein